MRSRHLACLSSIFRRPASMLETDEGAALTSFPSWPSDRPRRRRSKRRRWEKRCQSEIFGSSGSLLIGIGVPVFSVVPHSNVDRKEGGCRKYRKLRHEWSADKYLRRCYWKIEKSPSFRFRRNMGGPSSDTQVTTVEHV